MQPWRFVRITDRGVRRRIRAVVEEERRRTAAALGERQDKFMRLKVGVGVLECAEVLVVAIGRWTRERDVTAFGIGALTIEFGIMMALAYVLTRNIWLAVGIHMAWNFTQGYVFGVEVSGVSQSYSILKTSVSGPDLLTGGSLGPEGSIVALGISVVASAVLVLLILRKRGWEPLRFRLRLPAGLDKEQRA